MQLIHTVTELRSRLAAEKSVAFVPTMGNLHAGHLSLLEIAKQHGACVVVSIFVNRLQFEPGSDFDRYPRTLNEDSEKLRLAGADIVFVPDEQELYPEPQQVLVQPLNSLSYWRNIGPDTSRGRDCRAKAIEHRAAQSRDIWQERLSAARYRARDGGAIECTGADHRCRDHTRGGRLGAVFAQWLLVRRRAP